MSNPFTQKAQNALNNALHLARDMGHTYIGTEHLLLGLLSEGAGIAARILDVRGITLEKARRVVAEVAGVGIPSLVTPADMTPRTKKAIEASSLESVRAGHSYIGTEHLLLSLLEEPDCVAAKIITALGGNLSELKNDILAIFGAGEAPSAGGAPAARTGKSGKPPRSAIEQAPTLTSYGRDLCALARMGKIDPIIGRGEEMERVIQILSRRTKNNPCLIGEPGVGKTAVVEGLAQKIVDGNVPETLRDKTIVTLDLSAMIAGAKYRGEFEERMKSVMEEVSKNSGIILFIDEIHMIIGAGAAEGAVDAANILKPSLARGEIQLIGATTIDEYRRHIEKDAALERRFQSVTIGEPSDKEAEEILFGLRDKYEAHHKLKISDEAIRAAVALSVRYINDRYLPDKAIDLIDEAASKLRIRNFTATPAMKQAEARLKTVSSEKEEAIRAQNFEAAARLRDEEKVLTEEYEKLSGAWKADRRRGELVVDEDMIADIVTAWTGIPVRRMASEESERLIHLDTILKERVIGQDEAVNALAKAIRRGRTGLKDPRRPIGSFLFLGPTGVGKTELSKALADVLFGDESALIRVDMSEYMEKHSVSKMIGSPPGYVGYDEGGQLTEKIRRRPYSVLLLDEIEKAHPDVFHLLLQVLEDGILTDAQGRAVDLKNAVIIMTSNVGAGTIVSPKLLGFMDVRTEEESKKSMVTGVMDALRTTFRPEFLNRVDEIIVFNKLGDGEIRRIAGKMLGEVADRVEALGIKLSFSEDVIAKISAEGFDPVYGARPLRRSIIRLVEDPFSEELLRGAFTAGDAVTAEVKDGSITFFKAET